MNDAEYDRLCRDIRHSTQKIANDIFLQRRAEVLLKLEEHGLAIKGDFPLTIKKGRPKK
jgi:hypothetical protein